MPITKTCFLFDPTVIILSALLLRSISYYEYYKCITNKRVIVSLASAHSSVEDECKLQVIVIFNASIINFEALSLRNLVRKISN